MGRTGGSRGPISEQPTQAGPPLASPAFDRADLADFFRSYEAALQRLRPREQKAVRGRFEQHLPYEGLAAALGVASAPAARALVIRALGRLVDSMSGTRHGAQLAGLLSSVADGWPQDWPALDARATEETLRGALRCLRTITHCFRTITESPAHHRDPAPVPAAVPRDSWRRPRTPPPGSAPTGPDHGAARSALGEWGRFVLLRRLGEGAYGDVYQAYDTQLDRDVALKLLKPDHSGDPAERLLEEARMLARVRHPNVASIYGAAEHDGRAGLWMELIRGVNLEELLRGGGPMSACEAALVGTDVCRALAAVHAAGLVHRDVKTSNVMREVGGRIVLTDFGAGSGPGLRRGFAGTPLYLAPEVLAGAEASVRSDVYSLGVVLFRMVTGVYPRRVLTVEIGLPPGEATVPTPLRDLRPDLPEAFVTVVEQALAAHPADRPRSAGAMRAALGVVLGVPPSWGCARRRAPASTGPLESPPAPTTSCRPPA